MDHFVFHEGASCPSFTSANYSVMNSYIQVVGRLAELRNIVSRPELNGAYVLIQAYLPDSDRFSVQTLAPPNSHVCAAKVSVKLASLRLCSEDPFSDKYPHARDFPVVSLQGTVPDKPDGTVLKLTLQHPAKQALGIVFVNSCRVVGEQISLGGTGIPKPITTFCGDLHVAPLSEDAILEFHDIKFVGSSQNNQLRIATCTTGRSITFRRCSFHNIMMVVAGKDAITSIKLTPTYYQQEIYKRLGTPTVVFENCLFDGENIAKGSSGVLAGNDGTVTLLNCTFQNYENGVSVSGGGTVVMVHCTIQSCEIGVAAGEKRKRLEMVNCSVINMKKCGIIVDGAGSAVITGCRIKNCDQKGIELCGRSKRINKMFITQSDIAGCDVGVHVHMGVVEACIISCTIHAHRRYGLITLPSVMGTIRVQGCTFSSNGVSNILNASRSVGTLIVNGVSKDMVEIQYDPPKALKAQRCCQRAGICDVRCYHCGKIEEAVEKFKKCSRCANVCYCSRECQKAHWKEQKKDCTHSSYIHM